MGVLRRVMRGATLNLVIRTAADRERAAVTDRDLLQRFADDGDQAAFEALVRRHTGLVLGVCRRALSNAQDAEAACQATLLILARKAPTGRWQPSIANWLFATARRVARDLRRAAGRRAKREGRAAVPESVIPVDQMTGRELLAAIDEELDRLPEINRRPLLLCYLEGLSRDEAAVQLGRTAGSIEKGLERGRDLLRTRLTRRGVTLSAGLLAAVADSAQAGMSPGLVRATIGCAANPTANAVTLARLARPGRAAGWKTLGACLAASVVAVSVALGVPGRPKTDAPPVFKPEPPAPATAKGDADKLPDVITYAGTVTGPGEQWPRRSTISP